uniref:Uncharacterized protein n=1 Tax=Mustela putorius furo TaxID=9669 RepID=M3Z7R3_MUSPF
MARPRARASATGKEEPLKGLWQEGRIWVTGGRVPATGGSTTGTQCSRGPPASPQLQTHRRHGVSCPWRPGQDHVVLRSRPTCAVLRSGLTVCGSSWGHSGHRSAALQGGCKATSGGGTTSRGGTASRGSRPCSAGPAEVGRQVCRAGPHMPRGCRPPPCQHRTPHHAHAHEGFVGYFSKSCAEAVARLSCTDRAVPARRPQIHTSQFWRSRPTFPKRLGARSQPGRRRWRPGWPAAHTTHYAHGLRARDGRACRRAGGTPVGGRLAGRAGAPSQLGLRCRQLPDGKLRCTHGLCRHGHVRGSYICGQAHGEPAPSWAAPGHDLSPHTQCVGVIYTSCARSLVFYRRTQSSERFGCQLSTTQLLTTGPPAQSSGRGGTSPARRDGRALWSRSRPSLAPTSRPRLQARRDTGQSSWGLPHSSHAHLSRPGPSRALGHSPPPLPTHTPPAPSPPPHADQAELPGSTGLSHLRGPGRRWVSRNAGKSRKPHPAHQHGRLCSYPCGPRPRPRVRLLTLLPGAPPGPAAPAGHHLICPNLFGFF